MSAPHDDASPRPAGDVLDPASPLVRQRLGMALVAVTVLAVLLTAGDAPVAFRAPCALVAATLLPGYPLVARLPVDLPTLLALDVCVSLALEGALAFVLVETRFWHPMGLGLVLAAVAVTASLAVVMALWDQARP